MNKAAFVLAIETALALLVVAAIAAFPMQAEKASLFELHLLQKENDLLKLWLAEKELKESEMVSDYKFVFPKLNGKIGFGGKRIEIKNSDAKTANSLSSSALFLSADGRLVELRITVYY